MHIDLAQAGIRPPLLRALAWAARFWVVALLLPVRVEPGGAVWVFDLLGTPSGDRAALAVLFAALTLAGLGLGERATPRSSRALMAITASFVGLAGLLADSDAQSNLLPFMPGALSRGYVTLVVMLAAAAAGLRSASAVRAAALLAGASAAATWLYLWPHPFGALVTELSTHTQAILHTTGAPRGATLTQLGLDILPGGLVGLALVVRATAGADTRRAVAGWVLAALPATLIAFGFKGAAALGADSLALVGLRAAAILLALTLSLTAGLEAFSAHAPTPGSRRFRVLGHSLTLAGLAWALLPHVQPSPEHPWRLASAPVWADALYAHTLPRVAIAADAREQPGGLEALREASKKACAPLTDLPQLRAAVGDLGRYAEQPGRHRRRLERVGARLNEAARQAGLPYFVDLQVVGHRAHGPGVRWSLHLKTYRIERARRFLIEDGVRTSLWLRRLDGTNLVDARLGWTQHDAPEGMVVLGAVQDHWREDIAPALAGVFGGSRRARAYARYARPIAEDLALALAPHTSPQALADLLGCAARAQPSPACEDLRGELEPKILEVLAEKVEVHELRHAADGARLEPPAALLARMRGFDESAVHFASAELSAYLAEVAGSRVPRLALAHLLALEDARPQSPEGFAGKVAEHALREVSGVDARRLVRGPPERVAAAAAEAYRRLYGHTPVAPTRLTPAPNPPSPASPSSV